MVVGAVKKRLAKRLSERLGAEVDPSQFWINRDAEMAGCARWGIWVKVDNRDTSVYSWDTMSECLKRGFLLSPDDCGICVVVDDPA